MICFIRLFKGHHKPSPESIFRELNHCLCGWVLKPSFSQSQYTRDFQSRSKPPSIQPVRVQDHIEKNQHGVATTTVQICMKP